MLKHSQADCQVEMYKIDADGFSLNGHNFLFFDTYVKAKCEIKPLLLFVYSISILNRKQVYN